MNDTLDLTEQSYLRAIAVSEFPTHAFTLRTNEDGITWVVLEPGAGRADLMRVTICRLDPCVMVMIEDHEARRQFCSTVSVADAVEFVRNAADQAILTVMNAHPASTGLH
ncbi:hypothetical protein [Beijerinckia sp. L45]|uniref:hypothetical protein n=1 Tax=Beijerinckia sp. L45 TaxID=1641855 RepID=UPI00131AF97F|nr:hypothetical protein [Beijerinckia sp. L45]